VGILARSMRRQAPNILGIAAFVRTPWLGQDPRACVGKVLCTFAHHAPLCYAMHPRKSWAGFTFHLTRKLRAPSKSTTLGNPDRCRLLFWIYISCWSYDGICGPSMPLALSRSSTLNHKTYAFLLDSDFVAKDNPK